MDETEIKYLLEERSKYFEMKGQFASLIAPRLFELGKEGNNNIRNLIIISGTITPFTLLLADKSFIEVNFLMASILGFLLTVLFGVIMLQIVISKSAESHKILLNTENKRIDDFLELIDKRLHNNITNEAYKQKELELIKKIEDDKLRPPSEQEKIKTAKEERMFKVLDYCSFGLPVLFSIAIISLFLSMFLGRVSAKNTIINNPLINNETSTPSDMAVVESSSSSEGVVDLDKVCECEKTFKTPYPIEWSGHVVATFSSGADIGVKRFDQNAEYKQFYVEADGLYNGESDNIRVKGKMVGITCAYYNTIFGECVADVIADSVENIK